MNKTFMKVDDAAETTVVFPTGVVASAGQVAILDLDTDEGQRLLEHPLDSYSNARSIGEALTSLVTSELVADYGTLRDAGAFASGMLDYSKILDLSTVASGEVARFKPGVAGRITGWSFQSTIDATTSGKSASLGLEILGTDKAEKIVTIVHAVGTAGGTFKITVAGQETASIAWNAAPSVVLAALVALSNVATGDLTVTGTAGTSYQIAFTATGAFKDLNPAVSVSTNALTDGTNPVSAPTVTTTQAGAGNRKVGAPGNPSTLDLTSSNVSDGGVVAGETIATGTNSGNGDFTADEWIILTAASVTAFAEGAGIVTVKIQKV